MRRACDENPRTPAHNHGRQAWVRTQLAEHCGVEVSSETISKWFTGVARPRPDKITALARVLDVDEAWLTLGVASHLGAGERRLRNAMADGVVNVLAGFIQMAGGHPAFPDPADPPVRGRPQVDLYAIIKGAHYAFQVALGREASTGAYRFTLAYGHETCVVIGAIQRGPLVCDFIKLKEDLIERHGARRNGAMEIVATRSGEDYRTDSDLWPRIRSFAQRL